jgi:dsDNA-specific endonuclease/ATPase MutS2
MPCGDGIVSEETDENVTEYSGAAIIPQPFQLEITDILDLHTFHPKEIPAAVEAYLEEARRKGFTSVRIIHGKGIGVERERVRSVLSRTKFVAQFRDAPGEAGGWGATLVWLNDARFEEAASNDGESHA